MPWEQLTAFSVKHLLACTFPRVLHTQDACQVRGAFLVRYDTLRAQQSRAPVLVVFDIVRLELFMSQCEFASQFAFVRRRVFGAVPFTFATRTHTESS